MADDFELERLRAELAQEKQMKQMLDSSVTELQQTVHELEHRVDNMEEESNEWKTRYETQSELNQQLSKQSIVLHDKVEDAKRSLKDSRMPKTSRMFEDASDSATPTFVRQLEKEKGALESQLRDLEWRLDQESKAYHKANEERKQYITEISAAKGAIEHMRLRQKEQLQHEMGNTPRNNISDDHRILDPRRGPIKKTAAVKNLPSIH